MPEIDSDKKDFEIRTWDVLTLLKSDKLRELKEIASRTKCRMWPKDVVETSDTKHFLYSEIRISENILLFVKLKLIII